MESWSQALLTFILLYRYIAIFIICLLGALALPIPSGTSILMSFFFAAQGYMDPMFVALSSILGLVCGDVIGYYVSRQYGEHVLKKIGFEAFFRSDKMTRLESRIAHHAFLTVGCSRFVTTLSPFVNIVAGISKMPFRSFLLADIVGESAEVSLNYVLGTFFGDYWSDASSVLGRVGLIVVIALFLIGLTAWKWFTRKRR